LVENNLFLEGPAITSSRDEEYFYTLKIETFSSESFIPKMEAENLSETMINSAEL
jgi:hypothetical protein